MKRKDFIKACSLFGLSLPFQKLLMAEQLVQKPKTDFSGKVIVVGAGAAGLAATYYLKQRGIHAELIEASSKFGGRMKIDRSFTDFPLALGAEWLESQPTALKRLVNDQRKKVEPELIADEPDYKFVNYSWLQFYEDHILPSIETQITFNQAIKTIDYTGEKIKLSSAREKWEADYVILAIPLKLLQIEMIRFVPELPFAKRRLIQEAEIWDGFKAFVKFSKPFYDRGFEFKLQDDRSGQKFMYDATKGQKSQDHIVGILALGEAAEPYRALSKEALLHKLLAEIEAEWEEEVSSYYLDHLVQDWQEEPFIQSAYLTDHADWRKVRQLRESVEARIFFAGGAFTDGEDWVSVHFAALSAQQAVEELLAK